MERTKQGEIAYTDLVAKDLEAQSAFYEALFGWDHTDMAIDGGTYRMFTLDGHTVGGASQMRPDMAQRGGMTMWNTYIAVDDVEAEVAKAIELGGTVVMPPTNVMDRGRMAAIQDPTGAVAFLWRAWTPDTTETYGEPGTLAWSDLETRDPAKAADFYSQLVGWDVQEMTQGPMPYWQINVNGQGEGGIMQMPDMVPPQVPALWLDYFGTADINASVARAKELGATVSMEPVEIPGSVSFAVLDDPAGATFALMQPVSLA